MSEAKEREGFDLDIDRSTANKGATIKRLFRYALNAKKQLIAALLMLTVAVGTDLAGPLIAKRLIDEHITGIERSWHQVEGPAANDRFAVGFRGDSYKRGDRFADLERRGQEIRIVQVGRDYYFVPKALELDGVRQIGGEEELEKLGEAASEGADGSVRDLSPIVITRGDQTAVYGGILLSRGELYRFFHPELRGLIQLCLLYVGLMIVSAGV